MCIRVRLGVLSTAVLLSSALVFSPFTAVVADSEPVEPGNLLQFTSDGRVLGFSDDSVVIASADRMLTIEFLDSKTVAPEPAPAASEHDAANLERVTYRELWKDVTAVYEKRQGAILKSTYYIDGTDLEGSVSHIRLGYNRPIAVDADGNLVIAFENGTLTESAPIAWQEVDGERRPVTAAYAIHGEHEVGFILDGYLPGIPVVVDPLLTWSTWNTFLGSSGNDEGHSIALDSTGNVYVCGFSITSWGSPVQSYTDECDAFVAKLDRDGNLAWNTFLGGDGDDYGYGIAVDDNGNVYVSGYSDVEWSYESHDPVNTFSGGDCDVFAARLDSNGNLTWHTFVGGTGTDRGYGIAVDNSGDVYLSGYSNTTWGSPVRGYSDSYDAFAAEFDGDDGSLTWNTFLGGADSDSARSIAVDGSGNAYVAGKSNGTWGTPVRAYTGNDYDDAFAAAIDCSDGSLTWNTFLGGDGTDSGNGIAVDGSGNVYITGTSDATWGDPVQSYVANKDAFAASLNGGDGSLTWNTFVGGTGNDYGNAVAADSEGKSYVSGTSDAGWGSPVPAYAGNLDAFAARLNSSGARSWNAFFGSASIDRGEAIAVDSGGNACIIGNSSATWGTPVRPRSGLTDAFVCAIPARVDVDLELKTGWNMVSVPVDTGDTPAADVFDGSEAIYTWNPDSKSYGIPTTIEPEKGYWVAVTGENAGTLTVTGMPKTDWTSTLSTGWNMIGSVYGDPVDVDDLDDDSSDALQKGAIYHWNPIAKSYDIATQIEQGLGYWAACTEGCTLTVGPPEE
ncbi:MAG: SBBP repeat-containing protein [Dehalococcoidia bacterium]|nr:SBBP repeat-containing protein [Dehalococcoidia bacterium]